VDSASEHDERFKILNRTVTLASSLFLKNRMVTSDSAVLYRLAPHRSSKERLVPDADNVGPTKKRNRQKKYF
jgi:hypothetical protein